MAAEPAGRLVVQRQMPNCGTAGNSAVDGSFNNRRRKDAANAPRAMGRRLATGTCSAPLADAQHDALQGSQGEDLSGTASGEYTTMALSDKLPESRPGQRRPSSFRAHAQNGHGIRPPAQNDQLRVAIDAEHRQSAGVRADRRETLWKPLPLTWPVHASHGDVYGRQAADPRP